MKPHDFESLRDIQKPIEQTLYRYLGVNHFIRKLHSISIIAASCCHSLMLCCHSLMLCCHSLMLCCHSLMLCCHSLMLCCHSVRQSWCSGPHPLTNHHGCSLPKWDFLVSLQPVAARYASGQYDAVGYWLTGRFPPRGMCNMRSG
jgi:hypothetical protein